MAHGYAHLNPPQAVLAQCQQQCIALRAEHCTWWITVATDRQQPEQGCRRFPQTSGWAVGCLWIQQSLVLTTPHEGPQ